MNAPTLSALADPTRLRMVELLREQPRSVNEVAEALGLRQPQASKHLRTLSRAGVVAAEPRAQQRIYALQQQPFEELQTWLQSFEPHWNERLDALGRLLTQQRRGGDR